MAKRKSKYTEENQLYHLWANKAVESAYVKPYSGFNGRVPHKLFCETPACGGLTIYSYGHHFPIARHVTNASGKKPAVLFTTHKNSVTTNGQICTTRDALRKWDNVTGWQAVESFGPIFNVDNVLASCPSNHRDNFHDYERRREEALAAMRKAKGSAGRHAGTYEALTTEANAYAKFFDVRALQSLPGSHGASMRLMGLRIPAKVAGELLAAYEASAKHEARQKELRVTRSERQRAADERNCVARAAKLEADKATYPARLAAWYAGENVSFPEPPNITTDGVYEQRGEPTVLRHIGNAIETSRGVRVLYEAGKKLFAFVLHIRSGKASCGKVWTPAFPKEMKINGFNIERIDANGDLTAGCHFIPFASINALAWREQWHGATNPENPAAVVAFPTPAPAALA